MYTKAKARLEKNMQLELKLECSRSTRPAKPTCSHGREDRRPHLRTQPRTCLHAMVSTEPAHFSSKQPLFRFWHDEKRFKGDGRTSIAQRTLIKLGGKRMGGNYKADPQPGHMGWELPSEWDVLWSPSSHAQRALSEPAQPLMANHCVNGLLGSRSVSRKKMLSSTLRLAYGLDAFSMIMPTTFEIPSEVRQWIAYLKQHKEADNPSDPYACGPKTLWVLKTAENLGKGIRIVEQKYALKEFLERAQQHFKASDKKQVRQFLAVQRYMPNPLLINGCKFGLRLWVAVTGVDPLRVYLHCNGLALFSSKEYEKELTKDQQSHLTNFAQNVDGNVWSLGMLEDHLGHEQLNKILGEVKKQIALTFAAAAAKLRISASCSHGSKAYAYELFGADFLVDEALKPWLLEVNATPSLAVKHQNLEVEQMIHRTKAGMVADLFSLVGIPARYAGNHYESDDWVSAVSIEMQGRAGFQPLMHLFPSSEEAADHGWSISWSQNDDSLRSLMKQPKASVDSQAKDEGARQTNGTVSDKRIVWDSIGPLATAPFVVPHLPSHLHDQTLQLAFRHKKEGV